jgi:hypothetical protein
MMLVVQSMDVNTLMKQELGERDNDRKVEKGGKAEKVEKVEKVERKFTAKVW